MIKQVVLRNFKRFKKQTFDLDTNVLFAGQNNSGKTTVIQAIAAWHFGLREWLKSGKQERAIFVWRKEFSPVPLPEFNQLWAHKAIAYKEGEQRGENDGSRRPLIIEVVGEAENKEWSVAVEFKYQNKDQIYVKPNCKRSSIPEAVKDLQVVHIPSFSGISIEEHEVNRAYQDMQIGQGKPGEILRNLLQKISEDHNQDWKLLCNHIKKIFGYKLLKPSGRGSTYILCEYRHTPADTSRPISLDINTAGSGFQQVLLLLAFLYARPGSVVLIDEPDAHLHINLQNEIFDTIKRIIAERGGQLIVATHSEVLIDATLPTEIISFFGNNPKHLADAHDKTKLQTAMELLQVTDLLKVKQSDKCVLFIEGKTDFDILRAWALVLKHPASQWFENEQSYWREMRGNKYKAAESFFSALQVVERDIKGFVIIDSDGKENDFDGNKQNIQLKKWGRYEIESYLVQPKPIARLIHRAIKAKPATGSIYDPKKAEAKLQDITPPDSFADLLQDPTRHFQNTKASVEILPQVFEAASYKINKNEYHKLAAVMKPEEIHADVREMLDAIKDHFNL